jgi:hypothetical protein
METLETSAPKIAVKSFSFLPGAKPINFATKNPNKTSSSTTLRISSPSSTLGKRPRSALHDGSDDDEEGVVRHEAVTGFDIREGGALKKDEGAAQDVLVIPKIQNTWKRPKGKNLLPPEIQAQRRGEGRVDTARDVSVEGAEVQWGLTVKKKTLVVEESGEGGEAQISQVKEEVEVTSTVESSAGKPKEKTDDELALEALMGVESAKKGPDLVIPAATSEVDNEHAGPMNEEDAYRRAIRSAPDVSTLEDYERVPVEEFGAALLRGMGWKEGDAKKGRVARPKDVKRRQNLLGLGATELKGAEELGAWVQKSDPKRLGTGGPRGGGGGERRPRANEYREREERKRESRDERYGGSHRRDRDDYRERDRDRDRRR